MQLQRFFPDDLWSKYALQIARRETCIQHALVALASFHEIFIDRKARDSSLTFALHNYNLAIRGVVKRRAEQFSFHIDLFSCLIFISIEVSQICPMTCMS